MKFISIPVLLFTAGAALTHAQIIDVNFTGGGATNYSGWSNLGASYSSYGGGFPGRQPWPAPIPATAGATAASLNRTAGGIGGATGPYVTGNQIRDTNGVLFSTGSVYFGSFSGVTNTFGGTVQVAQPGPLSGLQTIVFQVQIGNAFGFDFFQPS